jgi:hypothetical protein
MADKKKFLVKNISTRDGLYRVTASDDDVVLHAGEQLYLENRPVFNTTEIKVIELK